MTAAIQSSQWGRTPPQQDRLSVPGQATTTPTGPEARHGTYLDGPWPGCASGPRRPVLQDLASGATYASTGPEIHAIELRREGERVEARRVRFEVMGPEGEEAWSIPLGVLDGHRG